jgi:hypothetical protein
MRELRRMAGPWWMRVALRLRLARILRFLRRDTQLAPAAERPSDDDGLRMLALIHKVRRHGFELRRMPRRGCVLVEDLAFNALLAVANQSLRAIAAQADLPLDDDLLECFTRTEVAFDELWDDDAGQYFSRNAVTGDALDIPTVATFLPLWARVVEPDRAERLLASLREPSGFWPAFPVPSVPTDAPQFNAVGYWKGPTWVNMNWAVVEGLRVNDAAEIADEVRTRTLDTVARSGFAEYFNPLTGDAHGADDFSWTAALVVDLLETERA